MYEASCSKRGPLPPYSPRAAPRLLAPCPGSGRGSAQRARRSSSAARRGPGAPARRRRRAPRRPCAPAPRATLRVKEGGGRGGGVLIGAHPAATAALGALCYSACSMGVLIQEEGEGGPKVPSPSTPLDSGLGLGIQQNRKGPAPLHSYRGPGRCGHRPSSAGPRRRTRRRRRRHCRRRRLLRQGCRPARRRRRRLGWGDRPQPPQGRRARGPTRHPVAALRR